ncbi:MAG: UvrD-helicase domain-containing protein [Chloroflexia bacterium]|nr:UvrD-helicase domain-containing protein [Chloroflexia bacterium]
MPGPAEPVTTPSTPSPFVPGSAAGRDLLRGLNVAQQEAVTTTEGPVIVVAGPGSGKTRVLTNRIAFLVQEGRVTADGILAVTFTNKAAREMRGRIVHLLGEDAVRGLTMGTFHALGVRILRENPGLVADRLGLLPNFLIYDGADQIDTVKRAITAIGQDPKQVVPRRMLSRISAAKSLLLSPSEFAAAGETYDDEVVARVYVKYQSLLQAANAVDFDDLLGLPIRLFDEAPGTLARYLQRYRYILVDEYQDTNRVQYVLISALASHWRNLFVVGDPDQSIYGWRQADIRNILDFQAEFPGAKRIDLEVNYRSTRRIVDVADRVIRENTQRLDRSLRTDNAEGEPVTLRELADGGHEAQFVVGEIRRLLRDPKLTGNDVAVMYRTTAQSRLLEQEFRREGLPYRVVGGVRFYERKEVKDILAIFRLLHNPADTISVERAIDALPIGRGLGPKALDAVREWAAARGTTLTAGFIDLARPVAVDSARPALAGTGKGAAERFGAVLGQLMDLSGSVSLPELFDAIVEQTGYRSSLNLDSEEEMQRWANLIELRSDLERYESVSPENALGQYLENTALVADVDSLPDEDGGLVTLITLHSAKGLEYPVVFIVGVEDGLLPISRAVEMEWDNPLALEEERRLFYVGITRARTLLYLTHAATRQVYGRYQPGVPSRFLAAIPASDLNALSRATRHGSRDRDRLSDRVRGTSNVTPFPTPARADPVAPRVTYAAGQHVFHAKFGEGQITGVDDRRDDQEIVVDFKRHGSKRLMASFSPLEILPPGT